MNEHAKKRYAAKIGDCLYLGKPKYMCRIEGNTT